MKSAILQIKQKSGSSQNFGLICKMSLIEEFETQLSSCLPVLYIDDELRSPASWQSHTNATALVCQAQRNTCPLQALLSADSHSCMNGLQSIITPACCH